MKLSSKILLVSLILIAVSASESHSQIIQKTKNKFAVRVGFSDMSGLVGAEYIINTRDKGAIGAIGIDVGYGYSILNNELAVCTGIQVYTRPSDYNSWYLFFASNFPEVYHESYMSLGLGYKITFGIATLRIGAGWAIDNKENGMISPDVSFGFEF